MSQTARPSAPEEHCQAEESRMKPAAIATLLRMNRPKCELPEAEQRYTGDRVMAQRIDARKPSRSRPDIR
jgi:hypothetical protein